MYNASSENIAVHNVDFDLNIDYMPPSHNAQACIPTAKGTSVRKKIAWAFYEETKIEKRIEDLNGFTNQ